MAYATVKELFTAICDAIRSKTGTTDLINHQDIPAKISSIVSGIGAGLTIKTGETTSNVIDTGLSSVSAFMLYKSSITATGIISAIYTVESGRSYNVYCSSYSDYIKSCTASPSTTDVSVNGGTVTWNGTSSKVMTDGVTYNWIAVGQE